MDKLLTTKEVAKKLNVSERRIRQFIAQGRLPAIKLGRDWIISKDDLEKVKGRKAGRPKKNSLDRVAPEKQGDPALPSSESTTGRK